MTDILEFSPQAIIAMGVKRIQPLVEKYGITSPEVLSACKRWGGMLDEVNYPDSSCRWCGTAVTHAWEGQSGEGAYYHLDTQSKYCWNDAPAIAAPAKTTPDYGVGGVRKPLQRSAVTNMYKPRKIKDNPQA
jgi:hypothetical protein